MADQQIGKSADQQISKSADQQIGKPANQQISIRPGCARAKVSAGR
jgi:hypothetical protein